jgi:hypothetical protein
MARLPLLPKVALWLVAFSILAVLFVRSARSSREAAFTVERAGLAPWSLVLEPDSDPLGSWLTLTPPPQLAPPLGRQIFSRVGESVHYPNPASMPLILRSEFDRALAGVLTSDAIMELARAAGLESGTFRPRCMARRRVSEPGSTRSVYFIVFEAPAFDHFRQSVLGLLSDTGGEPSSFDPSALSPGLIVAATNENFSQWLPLRSSAAATTEADCIAPIEVQ